MSSTERKHNMLDVDFPFNLVNEMRGNYQPDQEYPKDILGSVFCALSTLESREQFIIMERYTNRRTLKSIGDELNVSVERTRAIENKALRKLKHPARLRLVNKGAIAIIYEYDDKFRSIETSVIETDIDDDPYISELKLSRRAINAIIGYFIKRYNNSRPTLQDLTSIYKSGEINSVPGYGVKTEAEVTSFLDQLQLDDKSHDIGNA